MGYLHAGHMSLVARARRCVGAKGKVVVSVYVNPTQFAPTEDLANYPRDLAKDRRLCSEAGADVLFAPSDADMYPSSNGDEFSTFVVEESLSRGLEGVSRPTHFRGVTTVVAKLFNIAQPTAAVFGAKDYQQAAVIKRMVRDLNFPLKLVVSATVREKDGLALSSRNKYLGAEERQQALVLSKSIRAIRQEVAKKRKPISAGDLKATVEKVIGEAPLARLDYVEFFDPVTLVPCQKVTSGVHMALAVFVGKTRLIDNARL
jgi:pantoate--beta-alanine ligase